MSFILQRLIRFTAQQISALVAGVVGQKADGTLIGIDGLPISVSATPGGSSGAIQYNNAGALGGFGSFNSGNSTVNLQNKIVISPGNAALPGLSFSDDPTTGIFKSTGNIIDFSIVGATAFRYSANGFFFTTSTGTVNLSSNGSFSFSSGTAGNSGNDVFLYRGGAGILEQRNSTNAQNFRVFNTGDSTNGEWFGVDWQSTANVATIGAQKAGSGTVRAVNAVGAWTFNDPITVPFMWRIGSTTGAGDGEWALWAANNARLTVSDAGLTVASLAVICWSSTNTPNRALRDTGLSRVSAGVVEVNNGLTGQLRDLKAKNLIASELLQKQALTVATLPAAATWPGGGAYVTDALAPVVGSIVAAGGAAKALVSSNGTNWIVTATL